MADHVVNSYIFTVRTTNLFIEILVNKPFISLMFIKLEKEGKYSVGKKIFYKE